jgi:hypothetical protein
MHTERAFLRACRTSDLQLAKRVHAIGTVNAYIYGDAAIRRHFPVIMHVFELWHIVKFTKWLWRISPRNLPEMNKRAVQLVAFYA